MNAILASSSEIYGSDYLEYLHPEMKKLYKDTDEVLFIPFARPNGQSHDEYAAKAERGFKPIGKKIYSLHEASDYKAAIKSAKAIFVGGGNTFLLVHQLYKYDLISVLKEAILSGTPYLGTSAGCNISGRTMQTTNDMPIIRPKSFKTMGVVPFNFNVHYRETDPKGKFRGETRQVRIKEFQTIHNTAVIGLREGSWLRVLNDDIVLKGELQAKVFKRGQEPYEIDPKTSIKEALGL